jgi:FkbM family methyltransferase
MSFRSRLARAAVRTLQGGVNLVLLPAGRTYRQRLTMDLAASLSPERTVELAGGKRITFACPSYDTIWRAETFMTKEPDTLQWIDGFRSDDVLWDIGANVGLYTLYAATRGIRTCGFEPSAANYWVLNKNIQLNGLDRLVSAYCVALADTTRLGTFNMGDMNLGGALYQFGDFVSEFEYPGVGRQSVMFHQAVVGFTIDGFISQFGAPVPNHIKIDIDGNEEEVLRGATGLLANPVLRSLLVELDTGDRAAVDRVIGVLRSNGFAPSKEVETSGGATLHNFIFVRGK